MTLNLSNDLTIVYCVLPDNLPITASSHTSSLPLAEDGI